MQQEALIKQWIQEDHQRMAALEAAHSMRLNDWCIAAGFVRNLIWDKVHEVKESTPLNDIDLIYFNDSNISETADSEIEKRLNAIVNMAWSVKNQARMHIRNADAPYSSTRDAMTYWPEIETAIGVSIDNSGDLVIISPFGVESLFKYTITINPKRKKPKDFQDRIRNKRWLEIWPALRQCE